MEICPVNREWMHTYFLEPYLQGAEMVNRAWKGIDFHSLNKTPLSLKERIISWLVGMALMVPLVNLIIWIAWQTFGKPEKLFDPFCPEEISPPLPPIPSRQPIASTSARNVEQFVYNEIGKSGPSQAKWTLEHHPHLIIAQQECAHSSTTSFYKHNWTLSEFHHQSRKGTFDIWFTDPMHLRVRLEQKGEDPIDQMLAFSESLPWIQQPTIGFKTFILSKENEMSFYGVLPENPLKFNPFAAKPPILMKGIAKKMGEETVPGQGKLIKVEVVSAWGWPYNSFKGELWFDPATGVLRKFISPGIFNKKSGEFVQSDPLPQ